MNLCLSVVIKNFILLFHKRKNIIKGTFFFSFSFFLQLSSQIPVLKSFWILFPSLILMAGEYKGWLCVLGGLQSGECELFCFCFLWFTVPVSMNELFFLFFPLLFTLPFAIPECVFIFKRFFFFSSTIVRVD